MEEGIAKPGVSLYDTFEFNSAAFGVAVVAQIDSVQYWRDRPLFLGYKEPVYAPAIAYGSSDPEAYTGNPELDLYLTKMEAIGVDVTVYQEEAEKIAAQIEEYSKINTGEDLDIEYPDIVAEPQTIDIKDANGTVIKTIDIDLTQRDTKVELGGGEVPITILDQIPEDYTDDIAADSLDEATVVTLPDSYIRNKLWIANEYLPEFNKDMEDITYNLAETIQDFPDSVPPPENIDDAVDYVSQLALPEEMWYGIPLVNLTPEGTPIEEAFILHINTRKNWTLDVTNVVGVGLDNFILRIDKTIPPDKRFTAGLTVQQQTLTIYLQIEDDETVYESSINMLEVPNMDLSSYGADNDGLKTLCGYMWDFKYWGSANRFPTRPTPGLPTNPGGNGGTSNFYDGSTDRIDGDRIFPQGNWKKPAYVGGASFLDLGDDWKFVYNSYMDRFFCRYNLQDTDFTIAWYQYQIGYPTGIRTFVADSIHNNFIRYDYDNFEMLIDFNNVHYTEKITLPEFMWAQFSVRFNLETNELRVGFRDFYWDRYQEIVIDVKPELEFELLSLWSRFSETEGRYIETQKGVFGMAMIDSKLYTDETLEELYFNHKGILQEYNPRELI